MKKQSVFVVLSLLVFICWASAASAQQPAKLLMGTTGTASSHYVYSVAIAKAVNELASKYMDITVVSTGGAVDNLERLNRGQVKLGIGTFATFYQAYHGLGKYKKSPRPKLRLLWVHSVNAMNYIVRKDSGIKALKDLNGRKFNGGMRGSATEQLVGQLLETVGIKPDFYRASLSDAVAAVKDNRITGYVKASGGARDLDATTKEIMALTKIRILDWPEEYVKKIKEKFPFILFISFKENQIPGIPAYTTPVQVIGGMCYADSMTEEQTYHFTKAVQEGWKYVAAAFPREKDFNMAENFVKYANFPFHAGTARYLKELGLKLKPEQIAPEMKK